MSEDNNKLLLESMIGTSVSRSAGVQIPVDTNLPIKLPLSAIHYELYHNHVELHIEPATSNYLSLCKFFERHLPENEKGGREHRGFCRYAYVLKREVKGWIDIVELGQAINELIGIVEPVLVSYCITCTENLKLAKEFADYYEKQKEDLPFHINVIDELHASENAHSRILTRLLKYKTDGEYVLLASFVSQIPGFSESEKDINNAKVSFNTDFIDCLIECPDRFAIIIENKIHNAEDQDKQIERYVQTVINRGVPKDKVWVVYLTRDGRKTIDDRSYTEKVRSILQERFISMDYRHHVLSWLKDSVLPNVKIKEDWLISALKQYIDHLEGVFNLRESQRELRRNMKKKIFSSLGVSNGMSDSEIYTRVCSFANQMEILQNLLETSINDMVRSVVDGKFNRYNADVLSEILPDRDVSFHNGLANNYYQIFVQGWPRKVHFEWIPLNNKRLMSGTDYTFVVHIEDRTIENEITSLIDENNNVASEGKAIGFYKIYPGTYYRKSIATTRSVAEMTDSELCKFLNEMYADVPRLVSFIDTYIVENK